MRDGLSTHAIQVLQIFDDLREYGASPWARQIADVGGDHGAVVPRKCHGILQKRAHGQCWHGDGHGQWQLQRSGAAAETQWPRDSGYHSQHRVVRGPCDGPIVVQKAIGNAMQA